MTREMDRYFVLLFSFGFVGLVIFDLLRQRTAEDKTLSSRLKTDDPEPAAADPIRTAHLESQRLEALSLIERLEAAATIEETDRVQLRQLLLSRNPEIESRAFDLLARDPLEMPFLLGYLKSQEATLMKMIDEKQRFTVQVASFDQFFKTKNLKMLSRLSLTRPKQLSPLASVWKIDLGVARRMLEGILAKDNTPGIHDPEADGVIKPGRRELLPRLEQIVDAREQETPVRLSAVLAIGEIDPVHGWEILVRALESDQPVLRFCAVETIGNLGRLEALPLLRHACRDQHPMIRSVALDGLARLGDEDCLPLIVEYLADSHSEVAFSARQALIRLKCRAEVCDYLLENIPRLPAPAAAATFEILGQIGERRVIPILEAALERDTPELALAAANGLLMLRETNHLDRILTLADKLGAETRDLATTLEQDTDQKRLDQFLADKMQQCTDPDVQFFAIQILLNEMSVKMNDVLRDSIEKAAVSTNSFVRAAAMTALARLKSASSQELLEKGLKDTIPYVRACAVSALYQRFRETALDQLCSQLSTEPEEDVLYAILACLYQSGSSPHLHRLEQLAHLLPAPVAAFAQQILALRSTPNPVKSVVTLSESP